VSLLRAAVLITVLAALSSSVSFVVNGGRSLEFVLPVVIVMWVGAVIERLSRLSGRESARPMQADAHEALSIHHSTTRAICEPSRVSRLSRSHAAVRADGDWARVICGVGVRRRACA